MYYITMSQTTLTINDIQAWSRLDIVLSQYFGLSRNFFHHLFTRGAVTKVKNPPVYDHPLWQGGTWKMLKKSHLCKTWDVINIADMNRFDDETCLAESPHIKLPILWETSDYAVIYKPKWVYSHPTSLREISQQSVVGFMYHHYGSVPSIGTFVRAWLLHRLDRETDGLMIVALSERGLAHFRALFHDKSSADTIDAKDAILLKKRYRCTVQCDHEKVIDMFKHIQYKLPYIIDQAVIANVPWAMTKDAITILHWITFISTNQAQLELEILTWRTHQIRIHCAQVLKSPIIGDTLYWTKRQSWPMMLTAFRLSFTDPTWLTQTIELLSSRHDTSSTRDFALNWVRHLYDPNA